MDRESTDAVKTPKPRRGGLIDQLGRENRLKQIRMRAMLSQMELSRRSGVSPWTICKIEQGKRLPQIGVAYLLARTLGVSIEDIFFPESISILPVSDGNQP